MSLNATEATDVTGDVEPVEAFRLRARAWIPANLRFVGPTTETLRNETTDDEELAAVARERALQRVMFDGGFAGICVPVAYGGQGLTPAHQRAFNEEMAGHEYPTRMRRLRRGRCAHDGGA